VSSLASHGKTSAVAQSPVTTDIHQTFDGQLDFLAKIALYSTLFLDQVADPRGLFFGEILDLPVAVNSSLFDDTA
jgi:hypothetical protein